MPSPFRPARTGTRAPMAAGCGGHRMGRVEACWTRATSTAGWWSMLRLRGPRPGFSRCHRTSRRSGRKASGRTRFSNTSLAVRSCSYPGEREYQVCGFCLRISCRRQPAHGIPLLWFAVRACAYAAKVLSCRAFAVLSNEARVRVSTSEVETQEIQHEKPTLPFSDQWSFGYWTHPWLGCRFCAAG